MKNILLTGVASAIIISTITACSPVADKPFTKLPAIDSSTWSVNPNDYGMTAEQFIRAESLHFMSGMSKREGINNFFHFTSLAKAEDKWVVSPNNDVVYSMAIVDATQGFTLTLPETGDRFITAQIVSEEHMSKQLVGGGVYKFKASDFNGTHVAVGVRVGTNATEKDVAFIVNNLQSQMKVEAKNHDPVSTYDETTLLKVRTALMQEYNKLDDTFGLMTDNTSKVTDWERFTYASAGAWGLSEDKYAMYLPYNLENAQHNVCYSATYIQPEVNEFWSITAYNNEKYLMSNEHNIVNSGNVTLNADNTFTIHFGSSEACSKVNNIKNYILTTENNWGFLMRAYEANVERFKQYQVPELTVVTHSDIIE